MRRCIRSEGLKTRATDTGTQESDFHPQGQRNGAGCSQRRGKHFEKYPPKIPRLKNNLPSPLGGEGGGEGCKDVEKKVGEAIRQLDREIDR